MTMATQSSGHGTPIVLSQYGLHSFLTTVTIAPLICGAVFISNLRLIVALRRLAFANARLHFGKGEVSRGAAMHFGLYLKKKGIISAEQLVTAIEAQLATIPRIGQLALEEGILQPRDIFDVLRAQSESPDVKFGELAIEMRLMTRAQLTRLLMIQSDRHRPLAEILVEQGAITGQQARDEIAEFRQSLTKRRSMLRPISRFVPAHDENGAAIDAEKMVAAN
jgi:hypothetical protein